MFDRREKFTVTEQHIKLIKSMYWYWDDSMYSGVPAVDSKRPYGNSFVAGDVMEILGIEMDIDEDEGMTDEQMEQMLKIHRETRYAMEVFICTGQMKPGNYKNVASRYGKSEWVEDV